MSLFRREAIEFQRQHRQWGDVLMAQPVSAKFLYWMLSAAIAVVMAFLCLAPYARKQTVRGYLEPVSGTARVFASTGGVVQAVFVRQGQAVRKGQPLLRIGTAQLTASGENVQQDILDVLQSQRNLLTQQISAQEATEQNQRGRLVATLQGLAAELQTLKAQQQKQRDRISLAEISAQAAIDLAKKGLISNIEYTRRLSNVIEQRQQLDSLTEQAVKLNNQIVEVKSTLDQLPSAVGEKIQTLRNGLAEVDQKISQTTAQEAYTVESPMDGRIALLTASVGETADPRQAQMEIIPERAVLVAFLFVPPRAIAFVEPGENVRLLYDAFPYQQFGTYHGVVKAVSETMQGPTDASDPVQLKQPAYKVIAGIDQAKIQVHGKAIPLQPDMTLRADIILERRPLLMWLLKPLLAARM